MSDKKFMNAAKSWDTVAKVCRSLFHAAGIVCLIFALLVLILGEKMYVPGSFSLDLDFIKLYLTDECLTETGWIRLFVMTALVTVGAVCFITAYGIGQLRGILAPMKEGRPFEESAPRKLRRIAWTILTGGLVVQLSAPVERFILTKACPMEQIFASPVITKIEYSYTMDFGFVLVACIMFFLSYVFSYGQKLQQESDETL